MICLAAVYSIRLLVDLGRESLVSAREREHASLPPDEDEDLDEDDEDEDEPDDESIQARLKALEVQVFGEYDEADDCSVSYRLRTLEAEVWGTRAPKTND